jgi:hypothetical protein
MKKQIILSALLVCTFILSQAQTVISFHKPILSGKYSMDLNIVSNDSIEKVQLTGNLPHYFKITMNIDVTEINGTVHHVRINKYSTKQNIELFTSKDRIQKITIKSFKLDYAEYGDPYLVSWNQDSNQLQVSKSGRDYTYGNLLHLDSDVINYEKTYDLARDK